MRIVAGVGLLLLAACGGGERAGGERVGPIEPATTDSAGVAMHSHPADALDRAPRVTLDSAPIAEIRGSAEDEQADISTVVPVLFLADGRLVGLDRQQQQVVIFGAGDGVPERFGRQGAGPGEYGFLVGALRVADTALLIRDGRNGRLSMLDPRDGAVREWPMGEALGAGGNSPEAVVDGKVLLSGLNFATGTDGAPPGVKGVVLDLATGSATRVFTTGPEEAESAGVRVIPGPGGRMAVMAISIEPLQSFPGVFGWNGAFVSHDGNHFVFEERDINGRLTRVLRVARPRVAVTDDVWEAYISEMIGRVSGTSTGSGPVVFSGGGGGSQPDTADIRRQMRDEEHADSLPALGETMVTPNGTLWVLDYEVPGRDGWAATAFDAEWRLLGRIVAPTGEPPVAIGDDRMAFRTEDELGIATITVRRIRFPE